MSIIHRNQKSLFNNSPNALHSKNNILNSNLFTSLGQKTTAYSIDIGNNKSSEQNNSAQKRIELLAQAAIQQKKILPYSPEQSNNKPTISLFNLLYTASSASKSTTAALSNTNIESLQAAFDSNENPIINVTATGQKPENDGISFSFTIDNKNITINYDSSLWDNNSVNLQYTFADKDITALFQTDENNTSNSALAAIAATFNDIITCSKSADRENISTSAKTISANSFSCQINIYNRHSDIRDFLDNLPSTKKALNNDKEVQKEPTKLSAFDSSKLLDYITGKDVLLNQTDLDSSTNDNNKNDPNIITAESLLKLGTKQSFKIAIRKILTNLNNDPIAAFTTIPAQGKVLDIKSATARFNIFLHSLLDDINSYM